MNNVMRCPSKAQCLYQISRISVSSLRIPLRFAQTHVVHDMSVCVEKSEKVGKINWISGKVVLGVRSGSNWRAVVLSGTVLSGWAAIVVWLFTSASCTVGRTGGLLLSE